jgi:hypothetical protein
MDGPLAIFIVVFWAALALASAFARGVSVASAAVDRGRR